MACRNLSGHNLTSQTPSLKWATISFFSDPADRMESTTHLVCQGKGLPLARAADSDPDPLLQQTDVGSLSLPLRCSEQAATATFHSCAAPANSNLLPSTLNFIFLMKCHLLTSGRIIIKRNGHKAILCRQGPRQPAPLPHIL